MSSNPLFDDRQIERIAELTSRLIEAVPDGMLVSEISAAFLTVLPTIVGQGMTSAIDFDQAVDRLHSTLDVIAVGVRSETFGKKPGPAAE